MQAEAQDLLDQLQSPDANVRYKAWRAAGPTGARAVVGLAVLMASPDKGVARSARGALDVVVHYAARPGSTNEAHTVAVELLKVGTSNPSVPIRAYALHLLGLVGDGRVVPGLAKLLIDKDVREEARMALERIPGAAALNALKKAEATVPADFKPNIKQSLHNRDLTPQNVGVSS